MHNLMVAHIKNVCHKKKYPYHVLYIIENAAFCTGKIKELTRPCIYLYLYRMESSVTISSTTV